MGSPDDRRYIDTHEWHKLDGDAVTIGVSEFAVEELTDITFVQINRSSGPIKAGEAFGEIESVKATSELFAGIDGTVVAVNERAIEDPAVINQDPHGDGWLLKIKPEDPTQLDGLMSAAQYDAAIGRPSGAAGDS